MSDRSREDTAASVPARATQAAERRARWAWVEPSVWTDRMLEALEDGVKGGKWFSLIDKVCLPRTLLAAWGRVKRNDGAPGVDGQTVGRFERTLERNLGTLEQQVREGRYEPQAIRRTWIDKPGSSKKRPLGIPTVRDRVLQTALRFALEPIFERDFAEHSYGFRPGRSCKDALRRVQELLNQGCTWVVDADLQSYFDTIPHALLMERVGAKVADGAVLGLIDQYLKQKVLEQMRYWEPKSGTPQGAIISPLLANIYLDPLDHQMQQAGFEMVRYADDLVVLCRTREQAEQALRLLREWTQTAQLTLHPQKTRIADATVKGGFEFLGYHFERGKRWPRQKSRQKFKDKIRELTPRNSGHSLEHIVKQINQVARGWFGYFKHSCRGGLKDLDGWIRMRLRSILRRRTKRKGRGSRISDSRRWPNAFFAEQGLFSIEQARDLAAQSATAANH